MKRTAETSLTAKDLQLYWLARIFVGLPRIKTVFRKKQIAVVGETTKHLRRLEVLVTRDRTASDISFWIPRRVEDAKHSGKERRARKRVTRNYAATRKPLGVGEPRPADAVSVPLSAITPLLTHEEIKTLYDDYGFPIEAMVLRSCWPHKPTSRRAQSRKEMGEVITDKTPPSEMLHERQRQLKDHERLMTVLRGGRMEFASQDAIYRVSEKTRSRCKNPIPSKPMGRYVVFDWDEVVKWLEGLSNINRPARVVNRGPKAEPATESTASQTIKRKQKV